MPLSRQGVRDMKKSDPFGFDMSISSAKKKNPRGRRGMSGASETSQRKCDHEGCQESGKFRAPKSPDILDDFFWFCQEHVREYNLKWNFFDGTSEAELMAQQDKDRVWERPTKPFKRSEEERAWARLGVDDPHQVLGGNATQNPGRNASVPYVTSTRKTHDELEKMVVRSGLGAHAWLRCANQRCWWTCNNCNS